MKKTIEIIKCYVYCLIDPRNNEIFYIGKGTGNRVFMHVQDALEKTACKESDKIELIREIHNEGYEVEHYILRYGMDDTTALEVEAALIDCLGLEYLTNQVKGHSKDRGKISCEELEVKIGAQPAVVEHNVMIIKIDQLYRADMSQEEIYEVTRKYWKASKRTAEKAEYIFAVVNTVIRGVFEATKWYDDVRQETSHESPRRIAFEGHIAKEEIYKKYIYKTLSGYEKIKSQNPVTYLFEGNKDNKIEEINLEEYTQSEDSVDYLESDVINEIEEDVIAIKINRQYLEGMSSKDIYKATCKSWVLSIEKAKRANYVFAVAGGIVKEVFKPERWYSVEESTRIGFGGIQAPEHIRDKYIGKSIKHFYKQGEANPCKYFYSSN